VAFVAFTLTILALLAFVYQVEFAQAVLFMAAPMTIVGLITLRTARIIEAEDSRGADLIRRISRCRMAVQGVGMVSILATSLYGMYQNLTLGALGA
jgi:archaellum biogenesis protein FlaJ (TadC family)